MTGFTVALLLLSSTHTNVSFAYSLREAVGEKLYGAHHTAFPILQKKNTTDAQVHLSMEKMEDENVSYRQKVLHASNVLALAKQSLSEEGE